VRLDEGVLHDVLGLVGVAEHVPREREKAGVMPLEELRQGVAISARDRAREALVGLSPAQNSHGTPIVQ
jgi:hypothetical protein